MQNKIAARTAGFPVLFKRESLEFVQSWPVAIRVSKIWVEEIEIAASAPPWYRQLSSNFIEAYLAEPDLFAALLNHLRAKWAKLEKTKSGKLKKWLAQTVTVNWKRGFDGLPDPVGNIFAWNLQDGELAREFQNSPKGEPVTTDDVRQARRWVMNHVQNGEAFASKVLDQKGRVRSRGWKE